MFKPDDTIPQVLKNAPHLRVVFDRYGLKGCGGEHGPEETLEFFAVTHGVDLAKLLDELKAPPPATPGPVAHAPGLADVLYRPFFLGGVAFALVPGVILGLYLVTRAWVGGSLVAPPINFINAHAHSMVAGFVGMFIMGFGYQALPRFKHATLWRPALALFSFVLMTFGVLSRVTGELFALDTASGLFSYSAAWLGLSLAGAAMEATALALFGVILWRTYAAARVTWAAYDRYVFAAASWMVLGSVASAAHLIAITTSAGFGELIPRIAVVQEPLRMIQLLGCAVILILGVMQRFLPPVFGFADPGQVATRRWFWPLNLSLVGMAVAFPWAMAIKRGLASGPPSVRVLETVYWLGLLVFSAASLRILAGFKAWRRPAGQDRSIKFVRAAHLWLAVTLLLWLAEPLYIAGVLGHFGHGYHGAVRHTLTLGFIAQMIVAISLKVVPTLRGANAAALGRQRATFVMLNAAVLLRLAGETALDFTPAAFAVLGAGSALAALALLTWGIHVGGLLVRARAGGAMAPATAIAAETNVAAVLARWPDTIEVFARHGFGLLRNPVARNTLARTVNLAQACAMKGVDLQLLLADLRDATSPRPQPRPVPQAPRIDPALSVADVARAHPRTVPVFARLGLDACCGGEESVARAAEHNGYALEHVMTQLQEAISHDKS